MLLHFFPKLKIKNPHTNYEQIRFVYVSATTKWRKQIMDFCTTAPTIPFFTSFESLLKFIEHTVLSVTFTPVIYVQRLIMLQ